MFRVTFFLRVAMVAMGIVAASFATMAAGPSATPPAGGHVGQTPAGPQSSTLATPMPGCFRPGVPLCMDDGTTFVSADKMSGCQGEVKDYVDKTMAYLKCLNEDNIATGRDLTRNIDRFNCRLSGRKACN